MLIAYRRNHQEVTMRRMPPFVSVVLVLVASSAFAQERPMAGRFVRGAGEEPAKLTRAGTKNGDLGFTPYSSSYLPTKEGPLAKENDAEIKRMIEEGFGDCDLIHQAIKDNATRDTAAKFDAAGATGFRERYLRDKYNPDAETWEGLCHNWAPASLNAELNFIVSMDRIYADVPFGIGDLRETLTSIEIPSYDVAWFGKRNNDKDNPEPDEDKLDPVDLLTIFENYVGEGKPGIVMDVDPGYMVWNQPFFKWSRTATRVEGSEDGPKQPPEGGRAYKVKLDASYGQEGHYGYRGETISRDSSWSFYVYTDRDGNIVDSAWDPSGYNKIPDFAWVPRDRLPSSEIDLLERIAKDGVRVKSVEEFCNTMAALTGAPSPAERKKLKELLDEICPVLDQNRLSDYIRATAERIGVDYSVLEDSIRVDVEAHI